MSVVIPTHNRAAYISQAIDSVLQQTSQDTEIIVVDDESTDDTADRVRAYGGRVRYVWTPNGGSAHARNVGTREAHGRYLAYLDSDDLFYPYALELQANLLDRYPEVGLVYAEMSGFDDHGFFEKRHLRTYHNSAYLRDGLTYERLFERSVPLSDTGALSPALASAEPELAAGRAYFGRIFDWYLVRLVLFTNSMMMRRELVETVGLRNERIKYWEEFDYTLRLSRSQQVGFVDVPTYRLRYHGGQISTTARADGRYVWLRKQQILLRIVKRQAMEVPAYYERHKARIHRHLAHLHRAVAVPLLLSNPDPRIPRNYAARARKYLARCRAYGHPSWLLWTLSFLPGPARRLGVSVAEQVRKVGRQWLPKPSTVEP